MTSLPVSTGKNNFKEFSFIFDKREKKKSHCAIENSKIQHKQLALNLRLIFNKLANMANKIDYFLTFFWGERGSDI